MQSWHKSAPLSSNPIAPSEESSPDGLDRAGTGISSPRRPGSFGTYTERKRQA